MKILSPTCPVCQEPPSFVISPEQAFCDNDDCNAITWNMTKTRDENIEAANFIDLGGK